MEYEKGYKKVSDSVTEWTKLVHYEDINGADTLFGGRLIEWLDEIAGIAARRHGGIRVTTAAIDNLQFKHPARLNDVLVVIAKVTYVGRTSIEVRTDTYVEDCSTGMRHSINRAYFTEVCVDKEGHPVPVPYGLRPESESEKAEWEGGIKRREARRIRRLEGF